MEENDDFNFMEDTKEVCSLHHVLHADVDGIPMMLTTMQESSQQQWKVLLVLCSKSSTEVIS